MNISRILLGLLLIVGAGGAVASGTTAFFSDIESSIGNVFTAGAIDLLVDNDSYYNENHCVDTDANPSDDVHNFVWQGIADYPVVGTPCDTSWPEANLNDGVTTIHRFFNFLDVKPSDDGEDTISLHVQNDAWMCMDVTLTSDDDNTCVTDTENPADPTCGEPDADEWDGELAHQIQMVWWADDGDNSLEDGEPILSGDKTVPGGVETLYDLATTSPFSVALADSQNNAWGTPGPVLAGTSYIAKAWCFGSLTVLPQGDAGIVHNPVTDPGYTCDGDSLGNAAQTDDAKLDVAFRAVQARHNDDFLCNPPTTGTITVRKEIVGEESDPTPPADETDFAPYFVDGIEIPYGIATPYAPGPHTVTETSDPDYTATFSLDCAPNGIVNVVAGDAHECIITNTYAPQCVPEPDVNLVVDGGFENPEVTTTPANWDIFDSPAGGWTVEWRGDIPVSFDPPGSVGVQPRPDPAHLELHEGVAGLGTAQEGNQYAELDSDWGGHTNPQFSGEPASITIYQDIVTVPGAEYTLKYVWAARPSTAAATNRLEARADGVVVDDTGTLADPNAGITWIERSVNFTATDALTRLQFTDLGAADSLGTFLDNVRLFKISCPNVPQGSRVSVFSEESFGTGGDDTDIDNWDETGDTLSRDNQASGEDAFSPADGNDTGRFAKIGQDAWICRAVTTTGFHSMLLNYYWRGDNDAENDQDYGFPEFASGGNCATATFTAAAVHELDDGADGGSAWSGLQSVGLPDDVTLIRFRQDSDSSNEYFRIDGVGISGIAD